MSEPNVRRYLRTHRICYPPDYRQLAERGLSPRKTRSFVGCSTFSQAISRFFRLYTLSINEWTFLAPVGLIHSTSLLGRERTGFSLKELFRPPSSLLIWFPFSSQPSSPTALPRPIPSPVTGRLAF